VDGGHCDAKILAWYFDHDSEQCRNFTYSGCGGNDNRFETEEECVSQCMWITEREQTSPGESVSLYCGFMFHCFFFAFDVIM